MNKISNGENLSIVNFVDTDVDPQTNYVEHKEGENDERAYIS